MIEELQKIMDEEFDEAYNSDLHAMVCQKLGIEQTVIGLEQREEDLQLWNELLLLLKK